MEKTKWGRRTISAYGGGKIVHPNDLYFMVDMYDQQSWRSGSSYWEDKTGLTVSDNVYVSHSQFDSDGYPIFDKVAPCKIYWTGAETKLLQNNFTVQFWWKTTGAAGTGSTGGSNSYHTLLGGVGDGQVIMLSAGSRVGWWGRISGASKYHFTAIDASYFPVGTWRFTTFLKTNSGSYWYLDDEIISTDLNYTASLDNSAIGTFLLGRDDNYVPNGVLPVIMVYNRALTDEEIKSNYRSGKSRFK